MRQNLLPNLNLLKIKKKKKHYVGGETTPFIN